MNSQTGKWIIIAGVIVVIIGVIIYFFSDKLNWLGKLPGDIRIERDNVRVYIPVVSMLLISVALSLLLTVAEYLFRR